MPVLDLRGVTCDIIIFEEAAFIDVQVINQVAVPLMTVRNAVTLAISTPCGDEGNYYNAFLDLPSEDDPNEKMFRIVKLGLACDSCMLSGKTSSCTHKAYMMPPWKSAARQLKTKIIMGEAFKDLYAQENLGIIANNTYYYFKEPMIKAMQNNSRASHAWRDAPTIVHIGIDPSGGGSKSNYAMASVVRMDGYTHIVGLDHTPAYDAESVETMIARHLLQLRKTTIYSAALFVVYIEANMSWIEVDRVRRIVEDPLFQPVYVVSMDGDKKGRPGVTTTAVTKEAYVETLQSLMLTKHITYANPFVTQLAPDESPEHIKLVLHQQMRNFRRCEKPAREPQFNDARVSMSGKSASVKDDLLMALMFVLYFPTVLLRNNRYVSYCRDHGCKPE